MTRQEAAEHIRRRPEHYLKADGSGKGYICPLCGSGSGKKGTGLTTKDGVHFTCWSCGKVSNSDLLDIIGAERGLSDYSEKLEAAAGIYGLTIDGASEAPSRPEPAPKQAEEPEQDYSDFFLQASKNITETDYHRGISLETMQRYQIGYVAEWRHPKAPTAPLTPRLIIPTSKGSYLARDTRAPEAIPEQQQPYTKSKVGKTHLFNAKALETSEQPVFIVEGELDALSVIDCGMEAVALGSTSMISRFIRHIRQLERRTEQPLIIMLDNDNAGREAAKKLQDELTALNIARIQADMGEIGENIKDANQALRGNRAALKAFLEQAIVKAHEAGKRQEEQQKDDAEAYKEISAFYRMKDFISGISAAADTPCIPTGYTRLDEALDGGLYEGLYIIGAVSSAGKTTYILQAVDQIAAAGKDVLIFSLEMSATQLMARSISRLTRSIVVDSKGKIPKGYAKSERGITSGSRWAKYGDQEKALIAEAMREYAGFAEHIYIREGIGDIGAVQIREDVERHISLTGRKPVVVLDYLQILAPYNERCSDKQNTDKAVLELKRISRDFKIPVIAISSFNRTNYSEAVSMEAFKESGAIEYGCDVLMGLQLSGAGASGFNIDQAKAADPRAMELIILKNRSGKTGSKISYDYYPTFNKFKEV